MAGMEINNGSLKLFRKFLLVILLAVVSYVSVGETGQSSPAISLRDILPEDFINSANYRINILGVKDDFYQFLVESELGNYKIDSLALLLKRLKEIDVIIQISNQLNQNSDPYTDELQSELRINSDSPVDLLTSPLDTASNFAGQLVTNLGDTLSAEAFVNEYPLEKNVKLSTDPIHDMHKRNAASQLGLDVYTRNIQVQLFLNRLASLRSAGDISAGAHLIKSSSNEEVKISSGQIERKISNTVRKNSREELEIGNGFLMSSLNISDDLQKEFLGNRNLSPSLKTSIIYYLDSIHDVENLSEAIAVAAILEDAISSGAFLQLIKMVALYHEKISKIIKLQSKGSILSAITADGRLLHFYSKDIFTLSKEHERLINRIVRISERKNYTRSEIILYGDITDQARSDLLEKNIDYREYFLRRL